jgi:hypothetical protein
VGYEILGVRIWAIVLAACAIAAVPFLLSGFAINRDVLRIFIQWPTIASLIAVRLLRRYPATYAFAGAVEGIFLMSVAALFGLLICYSAAACGASLPLVDAQLVRADHWLGYDWRAYAGFAAAHPWLLQALRYAYGTNLLQPAVIVAILFMTSQEPRFEKFVLANMVIVTLTCLTFMLLPATTAWTFQGQESLAIRILPDLPTTTNSWLNDLLQIRSGLGRHVTHPSGIIAFPSFHCASAILNAWAVWKVRWARLPFLALNLTMIAATPLIGGHYVADLIGGAIVAGVTIVALDTLYRRLLRAKWLRLPAGKGWGRQEHLLPQ